MMKPELQARRSELLLVMRYLMKQDSSLKTNPVLRKVDKRLGLINERLKAAR